LRRMTVRFEGRVQGVGFRFTTIRLAMRFRVAGFVRNEIDGAVVLVAEGAEEELLKFRNAVLTSGLGRYITGSTLRWSEATEEYDEFGISY